MRPNRIFISILATLAIAGIALIMILKSQQSKLTVLDFSNMNKSQIQDWIAESSAEHKVIFLYAYDDAIPADYVVSQSAEVGSVIKGSDTLTITLSKGPDTEKKTMIPDFTGLKRPQIEEWFQANGIQTVTYNTEIRNDLETDAFISCNPAIGTPITDSDPVTVIVSATVDTENGIEIPDFTDMSEYNIRVWARINEVSAAITYQTDSDITAGHFISCDTPAGSYAEKGSTINFVLSAY